MGKVVCLICGKEFKRISPHIRVHNLSVYQYKEMFPNAKTISEESHQKSVNSHLGDKLSQSHKDNISKSLKGKMCGVNNPAYGKPSSFRGRKHTEEAKQRNREKHIGKKRSIESCEKQSQTLRRLIADGEIVLGMNGKHPSKETRKKMGINNRMKRPDEQRKHSEQMMGEGNHFYGKHHSEETKKIFRDNVLSNLKKGIYNIVPNKKEMELDNFLQELLPNEYKFVGDGKTIDIGGKIPDFINTNEQKKLIEFYGDYWHRNDDEGHRIFFFRLFGYETLIIWEHELRDLEKLRQRILDFHNLV